MNTSEGEQPIEKTSPAKTFCAAAAIISIWYIAHPYNGIVHDSVIYVGRALANLHPSTIGTQLSYVNDGQSKFSAFPLLMTEAVRILGAGTAAFAATVLGLGLWLGAATFLFSRFLRANILVPALLFLCVMPSVYGGDRVFHWAEPFATPRIFSEAASLLAIAMYLERKLIVAFICFVAAGLFHPLMALPAVGLVMVLLCIDDRRWLWVPVIGTAGLITAAALHLPLIGRLTLFLDPAWANAVTEVTPFLFPAHWRAEDWAILAYQLSTAIFVIIFCDGIARKLAAAALTVSLATLAIACALPSVLILQVQLWRAEWLLSALMAGLLPLLASHLWRRGQGGRLAFISLTLAWCWLDGQPALIVLLLLAAGALACAQPGTSLPRLVFVGCWTTAAVLTCYSLWICITDYWVIYGTMPLHIALSLPPLITTRILLFAVIGSGLLLATGWRTHLGSNEHPLLLIATVLLVLIALVSWDGRLPYIQLREEHAGSSSLRPLLTSGQVEWLDDRGNSWLVTGRPEWWGHIQGAGIIFDRNLAVEWDRRYHMLLKAQLRLPIDAANAHVPQAGNIVTVDRLKQICNQGPDWLVALKILTASDALTMANGRWQAPVDEYVLNDRGDKWIAVREYAIFNCRHFQPSKIT